MNTPSVTFRWQRDARRRVNSIRLIVCGLLLAAAAVEAEPPAGGLLFNLNYDGWSTHANFAGGSALCTNFATPDLQLRMNPGVRGEGGGLKLRNREYCQYAMAGNFDPRQGTISLWVNPQNWKGSDDRFQIFFTARDQNYRLIVYKYMWARINFYLEVRDKRGELTRYNVYAATDDERWQPGRWRKLDAVWNDRGMRLYVDGVTPPAGASALEHPQAVTLPAPSAQGSLFIGSETNWRSNANWSPDDETVIDDLRIFNRMLGANEIKADYERFYPSNFAADPARNLVTIPRLPPGVDVVDGQLTPVEWSAAAQLPIAACRAMQKRERLAWAWLKHDATTLRVALRSAAPPPLRATVVARDGPVWEDESFELFLRDPVRGDTYHFIVNLHGALFDEKNGDPSWNSGATARAAAQEVGWSVELALPLADLTAAGGSFDGGAWRGNLFATYREGNEVIYTGWSTPAHSYHDLANYGLLRFGEDDAAVRLESIGWPAGGELALRATRLPAAQADAVAVTASYAIDGGETVVYPGGLTGQTWQVRLPSGRQKLVVEAAPLYHYEIDYYVNLPLEVAYACYPNQNLIDVTCDTANAGEGYAQALAAGRIAGQGVLRDRRSGKVWAENAFRPTPARQGLQIELPETLPEGEYDIEVRLSDPSGRVPTLVRTERLRLPDLTRYRQEPAPDHSVPPPWTPVRRLGAGVYEVWGRRYTFANGPFPTQIASAGAELLRAPVELLADLDGTPEPVRWQDATPGELHDDVAVFSGTGQAGDGSRLKLSWRTELYFDGVSRTCFSLLPTGPVTIRGLQLRYALDAAAGRFVLSPLLEPWQGDRLALAFNPTPSAMKDFSLWVTGHDRGLFWWPESNANWVNAPDARPIQLTRTGGVVRVEIDLIGKPSDLKQTAEYTLAFMASPARQPPARARSAREGSYGKVARQNLQTISWGSFADRIGDDDCTDFVSQKPIDLGRFTAAVRRYRVMGIAALPYSQPTYFTTLEPEADAFRKVWELYPAQTFDGSKGGVKYKAIPGCSNSDFADYTVRRATSLMDACPELGGLYYDLCWVVYCANPEHGCGGVDAFGNKVLKSTAWGLRRALLGIYRAAHARNMIVMNHNHSLFNPIAHNFSDYWYPGEQYESGIVQNPAHFYCEGISLEAYQSELSARIKGVGMIFLPQTLRAVELNKSLRDKGRFDGEVDARRAMTPLLLHDIPVSANWLNFKPVEAFWRLGDEVDLDVARFTGYWEDDAVAVTGAVGVKASRYTWPAGARYRALIVVANLGREPARFDLRLDRAALGLPAEALAVEEALERKQTWSLADRLSDLSLSGNDYLLLGIRAP